MKLVELREELSDILVEHGDIEVYCECDHGQWPENVFCIQVVYVYEGEVIGVVGDEDDIDPDNNLSLCEKAVKIN